MSSWWSRCGRLSVIDGKGLWMEAQKTVVLDGKTGVIGETAGVTGKWWAGRGSDDVSWRKGRDLNPR